MKCIASIVLLALTCIANVFARKEVGRPNINGFYFACYDDGRATLTKTTYTKYYYYNIPATVTYQGNTYRVTMVQANAFNGAEFTKIGVDPENTAILIKRHALNGVKGLKEFVFSSPYIEPEIDAFLGAGTNVLYTGQYHKYSLAKLVKTYLKRWKLPYGRDYSTVSETQKMMDLYNLAKNVYDTFNIYHVQQHKFPHAVAFNKYGGREGIARLYRIMALAMGIPEKQIHVGCEDADYYNYCWNYVKLAIDSTERKWYVIPVKSTTFPASFSTSLFQKESYFITNGDLNKYHNGSYTAKPHDFIVYNDLYRAYDDYNGPVIEKFDAWLERTASGKRTL